MAKTKSIKVDLEKFMRLVKKQEIFLTGEGEISIEFLNKVGDIIAQCNLFPDAIFLFWSNYYIKLLGDNGNLRIDTVNSDNYEALASHLFWNENKLTMLTEALNEICDNNKWYDYLYSKDEYEKELKKQLHRKFGHFISMEAIDKAAVHPEKKYPANLPSDVLSYISSLFRQNTDFPDMPLVRLEFHDCHIFVEPRYDKDDPYIYVYKNILPQFVMVKV